VTLQHRIERAAQNDQSLDLSSEDVVVVSALLSWAERVLDSINAEGGHTEGGNSILAAFQEEEG
jgi:hypothetical protein